MLPGSTSSCVCNHRPPGFAVPPVVEVHPKPVSANMIASESGSMPRELGSTPSAKTMLVTGCNSGIGFETMRVLALRGAHVLGTARNAEKAEAAGLKVVMDRCPKIEYGRLSGEIAWMGVNRRSVSSRRPTVSDGQLQRLTLTNSGIFSPEE